MATAATGSGIAFIEDLLVAAEIAVDQIRAVAKSRLGASMGTLSETDAVALRRLITEMYGE